MKNLLDILPEKYRKVSGTRGGEYAGACPWCGGEDRFRVWPNEGASGRYWCRRCERRGDAIQLLRDLNGMTFHEARESLGIAAIEFPGHAIYARQPEPVSLLEAPGSKWQKRAYMIAKERADRLWSAEGRRALDWLRGRGLLDEVIKVSGMGYNPENIYEAQALWGLKTGKPIWIPRGITIPWIIGGQIWRLNVRRPAGRPKYIGPRGSSNGLYLADKIEADLPVVMTEGEIDVWSAWQSAPELIRAVATGSSTGSKKPQWIARLLQASLVLVAFDTDDAGEKASAFWTDLLPNAIRWAPYWADVNQMLQDGCDVGAWMAAGLERGKTRLITTT